MEQKENPVDAGTSEPDKENPYSNIIMLALDSSILAVLSLISDQIPDDVTEFVEWGMTRNQDGVFLSFLLMTSIGLKTIYVPANTALVLMSCICGAARPGTDPSAFPISAESAR